jgi:Domain of unknown function (DUF1917)
MWLANISPRATHRSHLICVYTPDFTDRAEVQTVVQRLDNLGVIERAVCHKPDIFTYAGIYNRTRFPIAPVCTSTCRRNVGWRRRDR